MEELLSYLQGIFPMSDELLDYLRKHLQVKKLERNDMLLREGRVCSHIYFILTGVMRCYYEKRGLEVNNWVYREGDVIVSVSSFFTQRPSRENIQALEDTILIGVSFQEYAFMKKNFLEFNYIRAELLEKYYSIADDWAFDIKMEPAKEKYKSLKKRQPWLFGRIQAKQIASLLAMKEETLSRIRKKLD
ncbi:MAG: hypothetical protein BGO55_08730 [Sphingobacteriales bacterium 50-39]|nr:Crp/Fnr family transcriptional regulator [Sphingobacteriales bacterium]OJW59347.1 MAG: hypothetical protein BGO55_08730 [Sphingobacteriales bacterium 50-39]